MKHLVWLGSALLLVGWTPAVAPAQSALSNRELKKFQREFCGQIVDHTHHHGTDGRFWSDALCQWRNLYVYLPPGYDPGRRYPLMIWLHGYIENEGHVVQRAFPLLDKAMACGKLPPLIVAAPGGTIPGGGVGRRTLFLNHKKGNFEDYVVHDVLGFMHENYPIRPEREAHVMVGASSGGWPAFSIPIKHRDCFGVCIGLIPMLNPFWMDCHGNMRADFDLCCWGWRTKLERNELLGIFYGYPVTLKWLIEPWFGWGDEALENMRRDAPITLLELCDVRPGELEMFIAYAGRDQLNVDAAVDSFVCTARRRGLCVSTSFMPDGRHTIMTSLKMMPKVYKWLTPRLECLPPDHAPAGDP